MISYLILIHDIMCDIMDIYMISCMTSSHSLPILLAVCNYPGVCISLVWYARPQLFFNCTLRPTGAKESLYSASHKEVSLVYFSTFEPIALTPDSIMQQAGVPMLYDFASNPRLPCLYICPVANVLGCSPLIPCFISGNSHLMIPHSFKDDRGLGSASADTHHNYDMIS